MKETYIGDGLYARFDGFSFWLRAPHEGGDQLVCLEPDTLRSFMSYVERIAAERAAMSIEPTE